MHRNLITLHSMLGDRFYLTQSNHLAVIIERPFRNVSWQCESSIRVWAKIPDSGGALILMYVILRLSGGLCDCPDPRRALPSAIAREIYRVRNSKQYVCCGELTEEAVGRKEEPLLTYLSVRALSTSLWHCAGFAEGPMLAQQYVPATPSIHRSLQRSVCLTYVPLPHSRCCKRIAWGSVLLSV